MYMYMYFSFMNYINVYFPTKLVGNYYFKLYECVANLTCLKISINYSVLF